MRFCQLKLNQILKTIHKIEQKNIEAIPWVAFFINIEKQFILDFCQKEHVCKKTHNPPKPIMPAEIITPKNLFDNCDANFVPLVTSKTPCINVCSNRGRVGKEAKIIFPTM